MNDPIIVQKYGGSSVASPSLIKNVAKRICDLRKKGHNIVVVVSAMGKTTDSLIKLSKEISNNPSKRELDMLLSVGERISMSLLSMAIHENGYPAISFTGSQSGIITDNYHNDAKIVKINCFRIREELEKGKIVIVAGFQGCSLSKEITTLGRGGTDTTAVALAVELKAEKCQILKDVEGVYSADPKIVKSAKKRKECSYDEMLEMSWLGSKVLHPRSVELAKKFSIPIEVCSSFVTKTGTIIRRNKVEEALVNAIVHDENIAKLTMTFKENVKISDIFKKLGDKNISCKFIVQSNSGEGKSTVSFVVKENYYDQAVKIINDNFKNIVFKHTTNIAAVSIIGHGLSSTPNIASLIFETLENENIPILFITSSNLTRTIIIPIENVEKAVKKLHNKLIERKLLKGELNA